MLACIIESVSGHSFKVVQITQWRYCVDPDSYDKSDEDDCYNGSLIIY